MWIDRKAYDAMRSERDKCWTECRVLSEQNRALQTTIEWLCIRVTQIEKERAALVHNYMGVKIETPDIRMPAPAQEVPLDIPALLGTTGMFSDIGDREAGRLGIGWDEEGRAVVTRK